MTYKHCTIGFFSLIFFLAAMLGGCASSDVSREAASNVDMGVQNAKNLVNGMGDGNVADSYQNSKQGTRGAILLGSAGAITGGLISGVGALAGGALGAIMGMSYGDYIEANSTLQDKLINRGANIIVLGDQVLIVIPSARLFGHMNSTIKPAAYSTLNLLAEYINNFNKILVKVGGYTGTVGDESINLALSKQQADKVVRYLMQAGVDARVLYAEGYGSSHLVSSEKLEWGVGDNYRIEVTLEKLDA